MKTYKNNFVRFNLTIFGVLVSFCILLISNMVIAVEPSAPQAGSTLEQRVAQRKQEQQITLDEQQTKRLQRQCKTAQVRLGNTAKDVSKLSENRSTTYRNVDAGTLIAIGKLKIASKDTFALQQNRDEFVKQVASFESNIAQYKQALEDASLMNCEADVVGFMALLQTARAYNNLLSAQSKTINSTVVDKIKPQLEAFSSELQK